jgi:hypothetical protein
MLMLDKNSLTGSDSAICGDNRQTSLAYLTGDCDEITCECCTKCCNDDDPGCNALVLPANLDGGYSRDQYVFSEDLIFNTNTIDAPPSNTSSSGGF